MLEYTVYREAAARSYARGLINPTGSLTLVRYGCLGCSGDCGGGDGNRCFGWCHDPVPRRDNQDRGTREA